MKEFTFKPKIKNIRNRIKLTRNYICYTVLNSELTMTSPYNGKVLYNPIDRFRNEEQIMENYEENKLNKILSKI